jgi:hypothetical protein
VKDVLILEGKRNLLQWKQVWPSLM